MGTLNIIFGAISIAFMIYSIILIINEYLTIMIIKKGETKTTFPTVILILSTIGLFLSLVM